VRRSILARPLGCVHFAFALLAILAPSAFAAPGNEECSAHSDYSEAKELLSKHTWAEAAIVLRSVSRKNPDFLAGAMELARALVYSGRREEALGVLGQAASRQKGPRREALEGRLRVLSRLFVTQRTQQIYQEGLNLMMVGKYRPARERFEKALESEPDNIEILTRIGQCLVLEGDMDSAAERLRLARKLDPFEPEVRLWLGRALHQRGELAEALEELKAAHEGLDASERAPVWYADALVKSGNRKAAVAVLEEDAAQQPFHLIGILTLAKLRTQLFKDGADSLWGARKDLQVALSRLPKYASGELGATEGELGVEMRESATDLKGEIIAMLAQLDGRLGNGNGAR
jgi:thioredoxin-like negative regulator of GroEL